MALSTAPVTPSAHRSTERLAGPDLVRAIALIGVVVINYHGYLIVRGGRLGTGWAADLFDPWSGPLATRFAATFVLVAGVGVTLLTRRARSSRELITGMRWRLVRRGAVLYAGGLWLEEIWAGTIIPYYGAMFVIAAALFTLRARWVVAAGAAAVAAGALIRVWVHRQLEAGRSPIWLTDPDTGSPSDYLFGLFVNGTHPLLPWLGFFCAGILLGRALTRSWWRPAALGAGFASYAAATIASSGGTTDMSRLVLSTEPSSRGVVYVASALGTALVAYAVIDWLAEQAPEATDPLRRAGQTTLTLYLAHVLLFNLVVDWLGWIRPDGLATALLFSLAFWVAGIAAAAWWTRRYGRGPAERMYRVLGG